MQLQITPSEGAPIYQQIVAQIQFLIASGRLSPGEELLPIRVLAEQLTINPNTVARAYLELERAGVVVKRHGTGTYVAEQQSSLSQRERRKLVEKRIDALLADAHCLDIGLEDVIKLLRQRAAALEQGAIA